MILSLCFIAVACAWLALPLVPAVRELLRPTDDRPLDVFQGNVADGREGLHDILPDFYRSRPGDFVAQLATKNAELLEVARLELTQVVAHPHLVHAGALTVVGCPEGVQSVHAQSMSLANRLVTSAKLTANATAIIAPGAVFQVLQAPLILAGTTPQLVRLKSAAKSEGLVAGATYYPDQEWWRAAGDGSVDVAATIDGDILVEGDLLIQRDACINGSIKAKGHVTLEEGAHVRGNVVAARLTSGRSVAIRGSVFADDAVLLGGGAVVGAPDAPASIVSRVVVLNSGCRVYGGIYAHERAHVPISYVESH